MKYLLCVTTLFFIGCGINSYGTIPNDNFRPLSIHLNEGESGWIDANQIKVDEYRQGWLKSSSICKSHREYEKSNGSHSFGVFVVFVNKHHEIYLPKEHKTGHWFTTNGMDLHQKKYPVKIIPTSIPISAFDEMIKSGLTPDIITAKQKK